MAGVHRSKPVTNGASERVFAMVLTRGPISRADIARQTGLSKAAVTKAAQPLLAHGYLEELLDQGRQAVGSGRPSSPLRIQADREFFIGVKVTEDHLVGVVTDLGAQVLTSQSWPLRSADADQTIAQIAELVAVLRDTEPAFKERSHCLGLAISGDIDRDTGVVRYSPFLGWRQVPLAELIAAATGLTVSIENDVKALAVAEHWFGAGVGTNCFAVVTVGIGIGCALVIDNRLHRGSHGVAGEIGHVPVAGDSPPCHCGGHGCVEAIAASGPIVKAVREATGDESIDFPGVLRMAIDGDETARRAVGRAGQAIGLSVAAMANLVGPERIIVTADLADLTCYEHFHQEASTAFAGQAFGAAADCELIFGYRPFEAWARGAAAVAIQTLFTL
jgi:predicted NBD/HSP70 family sugar kinase/biotin operon repressor